MKHSPLTHSGSELHQENKTTILSLKEPTYMKQQND